MEDVTLGLGGILGESTNLKPLNDRPFTKAAQQELSLGLKAKADEAKLAKEKEKVDREFLNIVKPISTGDEIADRNISTGYADLVRSKGYTNPLKVQEFHNYQAAQQRNAKDYSIFRANLDKIVLDPKEEKAFRDNDNKALAALATDPSSNVTYDQETERFVPKNNWARMDLNKIHKELTNFDAQTPLNLADMKTTIINGDKYSSVGVDPKYKAERLSQLVKNDDYAANFYNENKDKVNAELVNTKGDIKQAIYNTMEKVLTPLFRVQKTFNAAPKGGGGSRFGDYQVNIGGGGKESNGILMTLDPDKNGFINVKKKAEKGKEPEVLSATILDENGESHNFAKVEGYYKIGNNKYRVIGSLKSGENTVEVDVPNVTSTQLAKSIGVSKDALDEMGITFEYDKEKQARKEKVESFNKKHGTEHTIGKFFKEDPKITEYLAYKPAKAAETKKVEAPAAQSKTDKALAAFEKQLGRKPTATEVEKIKQKYK